MAHVCQVLSCEIVSGRLLKVAKKPFFVYEVRSILTFEGAPKEDKTLLTVSRRYSEFLKLDKKLCQIFPSKQGYPFPPKKAFGNLKETFIAARTANLQKYLNFRLKEKVFDVDHPIIRFLWPNESDGMPEVVTTESLAMAAKKKIYISDIPSHLMLRIFSSLGFRDVFAVTMVSKNWNKIGCSNKLWRPFVELFSVLPRKLAPALPKLFAGPGQKYIRTFVKTARKFYHVRHSLQEPNSFSCLQGIDGQKNNSSCNLRKISGICMGATPEMRRVLVIKQNEGGVKANLEAKVVNSLIKSFEGQLSKPELNSKYVNNTNRHSGKVDVGSPPSSSSSSSLFSSSSSNIIFHTFAMDDNCQDPKSEICTSLYLAADKDALQLPDKGKTNNELLGHLFRANFLVHTFSMADRNALKEVPMMLRFVQYFCPRIPIFLVGFSSSANANANISHSKSKMELTREECIGLCGMVGACKFLEILWPSMKRQERIIREIYQTVISLLDISKFTLNLQETSEVSALMETIETDNNVGPFIDTDSETKRIFLYRLKKSAIDSILAEISAKKLSLEAKGETIQLLVEQLTFHAAKQPLWRGAEEKDILFLLIDIENYVFSKIYKDVFGTSSRDKTASKKFHERLRSLSFVTPKHLDICKESQNDEAWTKAAKELLAMNRSKTCSGKLLNILTCCRLLAYHIKNTMGSASGADDFLPHLIYVVLKANPPQLISHLNFIARFADPSVLKTEASYYYTTLQIAVEFLDTLDASHLNIDPEDFAELVSGVTNRGGKASNKNSKNKKQSGISSKYAKTTVQAQKVFGDTKNPSLSKAARILDAEERYVQNCIYIYVHFY